MATPFFDTLHYVKHLIASNVSGEQAEAHARALSDAMNNDIARKSDLSDLRSELKADIHELRSELKADINELRSEVKADLDAFRAEVDGRFIKVQGQFDLLKWMLGFVLAGTASIVGLLLKMHL